MLLVLRAQLERRSVLTYRYLDHDGRLQLEHAPWSYLAEWTFVHYPTQASRPESAALAEHCSETWTISRLLDFVPAAKAGMSCHACSSWVGCPAGRLRHCDVNMEPAVSSRPADRNQFTFNPHCCSRNSQPTLCEIRSLFLPQVIIQVQLGLMLAVSSLSGWLKCPAGTGQSTPESAAD